MFFISWIFRSFLNSITTIIKKADIVNLPGVGKVKGMTSPTWKDSKSNILWAVWLFVSSLTYFKTALLTYTAKWHNKWWVRSLVIVWMTMWGPISKVFKVLRIFRLIRFSVMSAILLISLLYSPSDAAAIVVTLIHLTIMNLDVLFHMSKDKIIAYLDWVMQKANEVKPNIEPLKETLKEPLKENNWISKKSENTPWYKPGIMYKSKDGNPQYSWFKNDNNEPVFSLRQTYINFMGKKEDESIFQKDAFWWGVLFVSVLVIGGIVYYVYFDGENPFNPDIKGKAPGNIPTQFHPPVDLDNPSSTSHIPANFDGTKPWWKTVWEYFYPSNKPQINIEGEKIPTRNV
jgi:hypothetical protein